MEGREGQAEEFFDGAGRDHGGDKAGQGGFLEGVVSVASQGGVGDSVVRNLKGGVEEAGKEVGVEVWRGDGCAVL